MLLRAVRLILAAAGAFWVMGGFFTDLPAEAIQAGSLLALGLLAGIELCLYVQGWQSEDDEASKKQPGQKIHQ